MEFPAHRVAAGEASIAHELVHVLFPNANRVLAEGLAVYLQYKLFPGFRVYPNFGRPLQSLIGDFLQNRYLRGACDALWNMQLDEFERTPTPVRLRLRIGEHTAAAPEDPAPTDAGRFVYAVAGSLVGFLLENPIGDSLLTKMNFNALYHLTPLRPLERDPGPVGRWRERYRSTNEHGRHTCYSFADIAMLWKTYMHFRLFGVGNDPLPIPMLYLENDTVAEAHKRLLTLMANCPTMWGSSSNLPP